MKRAFTLLAALMLFAVLAIPMGMKGQSFSLVSSLDDLSEGTYCITALNEGTYYTVPNTTINAQTFTCTAASYENEVLTPAEGYGEFILFATEVINAFYIYNTNLQKYLVATGSKKFGYVDDSSSDFGYWTFSTVSSGGFSGAFSVQHNNKTQYMRAYSNSVRCYDGQNNNGVYLFVQNSTSGPSISASNVEIAYDATGGEIAYSINNPVAGSALTASTQSDWLENVQVGTSSVTFNCDPNQGASARTATVTLSYPYDNQYITKNVTVTQAGNPDVVNTISEITAAGNYTVQGTIVAINQRGFILGDGTGYVYYYYGSGFNSNSEYSVDDIVKISGEVSAPTNYKVFQFGSSATITEAETSNYQTEAPTAITGADMDAVVTGSNVILSSYVQYEGTLTVSGTYYNITGIDGASTAKGSISYPTNTDFTSLTGKNVIVKGYYVGVSSNQYYNTMLGSIEEVVNEDPTITVETPEPISYEGDEIMLAITYANFEVTPTAGFNVDFCDAEGNSTPYEWITGDVSFAQNNNTYYVALECEANDGAQRTAYLKVYYGNYSSDVVAITQEGSPSVVNSISDITSAGTYIVQGTIVALNTRGFILGDGTGYVYYYSGNGFNSNSEYAIGDFVKLSGDVSAPTNYKVFQFGSSATITEAETSNYQTEAPTTITGAEMDAVVTGSNVILSSYVQYEGTLTVSGTYYNITGIDGATTAKGSISYPTNTDFTSLNGKNVIVKGYYVGVSSNQYYNTMLGSVEEVVSVEPSITIDPATYEVSADGGEEQLTIVCTNFTPDATQGFTVMFCDAEGNAIDTPEWISAEEVQYEYESGACSVIINFEENETEESRTAYFMVMYGDYVSNMVTFTQAGYVAPFDSVTYTLATSIESGKSYIIVGCKTINEETTYYAMGEQKNTNRSGVLISVDGTTATVSTADVHEVVITALEDAAGFYSIYDGGYLYAAGSNANQLKTKAELDVNGQWAINIEDGAFSIVASESSNRNVMQFNYNGGNPLFNCYSSASQSPVYLYVKDGGNIIDVVDELIVEVPEENDIYIVHDGAVLTLTGEVPDTWDESHIIVEDGGELFHDAAVPATLKKDIVGYNGKGVTGYYLVAAPVYNPFASDYAYPIPAALLSSLGGVEFDLYMFDESAEKEWLNYKDESNPFNGNLHVGVGYLFSYNISKIAEFPGMTIPTSTNFTVKLQKTTGATFSGLNLVGNPYTATAFLADGRDFYVLNDDGDIVKSTKAKIEPVQGLFVVANNNNEDLIFTTTEPSKCAALNIDLSQNNALVDVASINFNKTNRLEKFQLNPNHTKIFFSEAGKDYASIDANSSDAMTLNFKAEYDGTYTINVNTENIEMGYLHLIDNMTGADIDLLANPSYSFEAKTTDYASRFRLVFSDNSSDNNENFAFFSNGNIIVNGEGTLQVIDITGRVISTEQVNGISSVNVNANGVYVLQLVNGSEVKTQKIVVK